ncbi:MAG: hypothetical protein RR614_09480 [Eubacterium sp.]
MEKASGKTLIKITGIILIVLGAIFLLTGALSMLGSSMMGSVADDPTVQAALAQSGSTVSSDDLAKMAMISGTITLVLGIVCLAVGILGAAFSKRTDKAKLLMIISAILTAGFLANTIVNIVNNAGTVSVFMNLAQIIIAGLFFLGAKLNNDDAKAAQTEVLETEAVVIEEENIEIKNDETEE